MSKALVTVALLVSMVFAVPAAHATHVCVENNQLTFSPPLTLANQSGTATLSWQNACPYTDDGYNGTTGSLTFPFTGNCVLVQSTEPFVHLVIVGGSISVETYSDPPPSRPLWIKIEAMRTDGVCPISSASGTGGIVWSQP
jgi:hypothetical protein